MSGARRGIVVLDDIGEGDGTGREVCAGQCGIGGRSTGDGLGEDTRELLGVEARSHGHLRWSRNANLTMEMDRLSESRSFAPLGRGGSTKENALSRTHEIYVALRVNSPRAPVCPAARLRPGPLHYLDRAAWSRWVYRPARWAA